MKKKMGKISIWPLFVSAVLALELLFLIDAVVVFCGGALSITVAAALGMVLAVLFLILFRRIGKQLAIAVAAIPATVALVMGLTIAAWRSFSDTAVYNWTDSGKNAIYADRKVMMVVPHQDDDLNILGGVTEEYVRYGSEVYAVFVTNGDYQEGMTEIRYRETVRVFEAMGISEDHLIFLGYASSWETGGPHIYNAESGALVKSSIGRTETYCTEDHPAYREGNAYTLENLTEDLKSVILEYRPDVIFSSDYDTHVGHKAVTLLFDKVMGQVLKENPGYSPVVYKAYAYGTAWEAEPDFYAQNILSTQNPFGEPYNQKPAVYHWEERVRFPVKGNGLSRSLMSAEGYGLLGMYESQGAQRMASAVINGDKVAWRRHTESLALVAEVSATSGRIELLNDFMLIENNNVVDDTRKPYDGVWIPEKEDEEKTVSVVLAETSAVYAVVLYDHPSSEHNVLNAVIRFDDGTEIETGSLDAGGASAQIVVQKENVSAFTVTLEEIQGENAGLSEIEVLPVIPETDGKFIKLTDEDGNFLYDCQTGLDGTARLQLYRHGDLPELSSEQYTIKVDGEIGAAVLKDGVIQITCPETAGFELEICCDSESVSDTIYVRNTGKMRRIWENMLQEAEKNVALKLQKGDQNKLLIYSVPEKVSHIVGRLLK